MDREPERVDFKSALEQSGWLRTLAVHLVGPDQAEDLVQDTWVRALERPPRHAASLRGWLTRVVTTLSLDSRRSTVRRKRREAKVAGPAVIASPDETAAVLEVQEQVMQAVQALPEPYQTTVVLRYYEGLTSRQIAEHLGIAPSTARNRLARGLHSLRKNLETRHGRGWRGTSLALLMPGGASALPSAAATAGLETLAMTMKSKLILAATALVVIAGVLLWPDDSESGNGDSTEVMLATAASPVETPELNPSAADLNVKSRVPMDSVDIVDPVGSAREPLHGTVFTGSRPCPQALVVMGEEQARTDANGMFSFPDAPLGTRLEVSCEGWTPWTGVVEDSPMEIKLWPLINLAVAFPADDNQEVQYKIWRIPYRWSIKEAPYIGDPELIREGTALLNGEWALFPQSPGSIHGRLGYVVELYSGDSRTYSHFFQRSSPRPGAPKPPFFIAEPPSPLGPDSLITRELLFLSPTGLPLQGKRALIPSAHTFPRIWRETRTNQHGIVEVTGLMSRRVLESVVVIFDEGQFMTGRFSGMNEVTPGRYEVRASGLELGVSVKGKIPDGFWIEVQQTARDADGDSCRLTLGEFSHAWTRLSSLEGEKVPLSCLSKNLRVHARLMPTRVPLGTIETEYRPGLEVTFELPKLHVLSFEFDRAQHAGGELHLYATRRTDRALNAPGFTTKVIPESDSMDIQVISGNYTLKVYEAETEQVLATSSFQVEGDLKVSIPLAPSVQAVVTFNGNPVRYGVLAYQSADGQWEEAKISTDGRAEMQAVSEESKFLVVPSLPMFDPAKVWEGPDALMLGAPVDRGVSFEQEITVQVPSAILKFPVSEGPSEFKIQRKTSPFSSADLIVGPAGLQLTLPVGKYLVTKAGGESYRLELQQSAVKDLADGSD